MTYNKKDWRKIKLNKKQKAELSLAEKDISKLQFLKRIQSIKLKNK